MNALSRIKSLALTKQTSLSIALGGLFVLSPLYVNFGGSTLASLIAIVFGILAIAVASAEAAGSPRIKNHGWPLAAIAAAILVSPWILALTGVGQVLSTFSIAALALFAAATWSVTSPSVSEDFATMGAEPKDERDDKTSSVADGEYAITDKVVGEGKQAAFKTPLETRPVDEPQDLESGQAPTGQRGDEKGKRTSSPNTIANDSKEVLQANDDHKKNDNETVGSKASADISAIKSDTSTRKKPTKERINEPANA